MKFVYSRLEFNFHLTRRKVRIHRQKSKAGQYHVYVVQVRKWFKWYDISPIRDTYDASLEDLKNCVAYGSSITN